MKSFIFSFAVFVLLATAEQKAAAQSPPGRNPDVSNKALITKSTPSINADTFKNQSVNAATIAVSTTPGTTNYAGQLFLAGP